MPSDKAAKACSLHFYLNRKGVLVIQETGLNNVVSTSHPVLIHLTSIQLEDIQKFTHFLNPDDFPVSLSHL